MECIEYCTKLNYEPFEIILLPDSAATVEGVKMVPTGPISPGKKRNIGAKIAVGDVYAYIDADAYPRQDWLANAIRHVQEDGVGAVGGPALTSPYDSRFCQAQGFVLSSFLVSGRVSARYKESGTSDTDDIHSVNLVVWRRVVEEVGGWNEKYWPGEDTLFCLAIRKAGYRQLLASDVVVYHHRRPKMAQYLHQISSFGIHRGYFAKRFPGNSRRLGYFTPSMIVAGLVFGPAISVLIPLMWWVYFGGLAIYAALLVSTAAKNKGNRFTVFILILITHLAYGVGFVRGLLAGDLRK